MERKLVTIQKIESLSPIPGADKIEVAKIKGWEVVVQKDQFKVGDLVLYFEIDSFLPLRPEYEFLLRGSKPKKMIVDGKEVEGIRLKTIKLCNQISQGLIMPLGEIQGEIGDDVSERLGVIKFEIPIPVCLSGVVKGNFPSFLPKTDEERIQNRAEVLSSFVVSEKIDGSSCSVFKKDGVLGVCSRNLELVEGDCVQWRLARELDLANKLPDNFALQGEVVGEGIQGNPLKLKGQQIFFFNAYNISSGIYLNYADFVCLCNKIGVKTVPIVDDNFSLPNSVDEMLKYAEGKSLLNPNCEREGVVVRPKVEMKYKGERFSFKAISNSYLLRNE
jgi:RNA ligase (TIGR02306 family)